MLPASEYQYAEHAAQLVPVFFTGAELAATFLIQRVGQFENLMEEKCQQIEDEKDHRQIVFPVTVIVLDMIALILQSVKGFVFDFPAGAPYPHKFFDIFFIDEDVGHPTVAIGDLSVFDELVFEKVYVIGVFRSV